MGLPPVGCRRPTRGYEEQTERPVRIEKRRYDDHEYLDGQPFIPHPGRSKTEFIHKPARYARTFLGGAKSE